MKFIFFVFSIMFILLLIVILTPQKSSVNAPTMNQTPEQAMLQVAQTKMNDLLKTNYWSHTNSDGCDFDCRVKDVGKSGIIWIGENLYTNTCDSIEVQQGHCTLEEAYKMWHNSPAHEKILQHSYTRLLILQEHKDDIYYIIYLVSE